MKKIEISALAAIILIITLLCICCPIKNNKKTEEPAPVVEVAVAPDPEPVVEPEPVPEPTPEPEPVVIPEPEPEPEPVPQPPAPPKEDDEEYLRSINNLDGETVTKEEFSDDKTAVLKVINELSTIMDTKDVNAWLKYIEPSSKDYYSNITNLKKAQKKLPNKSINLNNINDYFIYVFIPSRKRSQVDEIRYINKNSIKAVQVKDDNSIVVYYYFTKINNKWMVHLPPVS